MNLLVKFIYMFLILVGIKMYLPSVVSDNTYQQIAMIAIILFANLIYRYFVNYYYQKKNNYSSMFKEGMSRTAMIVGGIYLINYLFANPETIQRYNINIPNKNIYSTSFLSLVPYALTKSLLSPDL